MLRLSYFYHLHGDSHNLLNYFLTIMQRIVAILYMCSSHGSEHKSQVMTCVHVLKICLYICVCGYVRKLKGKAQERQVLPR